MQKVCRNPEEITPALYRIHFREAGRQETAVAFLKQVVSNITASRYPQKIGPQRTVGPGVEDAKVILVHTRPVRRVGKRISQRFREFDARRAALGENPHGSGAAVNAIA